MERHIDFLKLKTSWTKYDIVQALDVTYSVETIQRFMNKEIGIDEPILRSFLGVKDIKDPIPEYWIEIQKYPTEKKIFSLLALLFTHGGVIAEFADQYSTGNMKGIFKMELGKQYTNIRSALVEAGAAEPFYRRQEKVPYDFSIVFYNPAIGKLFKEVLIERFSRLFKGSLSDEQFYEECFYNHFHNALGLNQKQFRGWLEGIPFESHYISRITVDNFFSIKHIELDFNDSKEVYFLGENGDGKSLILMALYLAFNGNYITTKTDQEETGKAVDILRKNRNLQLKGYDEFDKEYNPQQANYIENIYAYGTHRGRYSANNPEVYGFMSLFDFNATLNDPIAWLKNQKLLELENFNNNNQNNIFHLATAELENIFHELLEKNVKVEIQGTDVYFIEKGYKLSFDQLSEGYRSVIIFVCDILYRLSLNLERTSDIKSIKGVVIVDEIDLHLHPKWQRIIIKRLRMLFPYIQFFFTTHSPTIIQGASNDAIVYRVYRENGETKVSDTYLRKDLNHLMINTLVTSPLFGLDDSRLDSDNENSNTDDDYLLYKVNNTLRDRLSSQKMEGKNFISDQEVDDIINSIINEELKDD